MNPAATAADTPRRALRLAAAAALLLALAAAAAWWWAAGQLERSLRDALGPRSTVGAVSLGWGGVQVQDLRVAAAPGSGWPAADELRAAHVRVEPDVWAALRGRVAIRRVVVEDAYVSLLRTRNGKLRALPALLDTRASAAPTASARSGIAATLARVELRRSEVAFFDASVRRPPLALRLTDFDAQLGPLALPALDVPTRLSLSATVKGLGADGRHDGTLALDGEVNGASQDAALRLQLRGVDLRALQPYLMRVADGGIKRGRLDLDLAPTVKRQHLRAPGKLVLTGLELGDSGLAGLPRQAVLGFMSKNERIDLDFTLDGRLDDPAFSLNENLATRVASAMADKLGVSVGGVVEGVGGVIKGLFGK